MRKLIIESGGLVEGLPHRTNSQKKNPETTNEQRLSYKAYFEQKRFDYLGINLKCLKENVYVMEEELNRIKNSVSSQKRVRSLAKEILPVQDLESSEKDVSAEKVIEKEETPTIKRARSFMNSRAMKNQKFLIRCQSEHQILDPNKRGRGGIKLDDYMKNRDLLLSARYGEEGKGFFHERVVTEEREKPIIESLLPPPEPVARVVAPTSKSI